MKRKIFALLGAFILVCLNASAIELPAEDANIIKAAGVSIHPDITFVYGNQDVGYRFATAKSPDEIRQWYRENFPIGQLWNRMASGSSIKVRTDLDSEILLWRSLRSRSSTMTTFLNGILSAKTWSRRLSSLFPRGNKKFLLSKGGVMGEAPF